ncbi:MAG TPA: polyprenyl synthetase family protein [Actinomycetes bacterium]|nr:polyprenyl synthetase family protein [Actinomycetes bacterium]
MEPSPLDVEDLRVRVQKHLDAFLGAQVARLDDVDPDVEPLMDALTDLLVGGKRLRPAFCWWGWRGAGGPDDEAAMVAATSLELLQACALVHDDVMDGSDTRRGRPAAHRRFAALHRVSAWLGSSETFGVGAAILLGDLCLSWADQLLSTCGLPDPALRRAKPVFDVMRTELMAGQYLDLLEQARGGGSVGSALRVVRFKSAKYTVERPLHLGIALAGGGPELMEASSRYGLPLGEAFQLRDDVLGVFGDPQETGKPAGDDLREGKRTVLVALALEAASPAQAGLLRRDLGDPALTPDGVAGLREVITETGALARVEQLITARTEEAVDALATSGLAEPARAVLADLAVAATARRG